MAGPSQTTLAIPPTRLDQLPQDIQEFLTKRFANSTRASTTLYENNDRVRPLQVYQVAVLHLPKKDLMDENFKLRTGLNGDIVRPFVQCGHSRDKTELYWDDWVYNHPILVLSRPAQDQATIYFCLMTTFRMQPVEQKFPGQWQKWQYYLAVDPAGQRPIETHPTLSFRDMRKSKKAGYVRTNAVYSMSYADATRFHDRNSPADRNDSRVWRLQDDSMKAVLYHVKCHTGWEPNAPQHEINDQDYWASLPIYHGYEAHLSEQNSVSQPQDPRTQSTGVAPNVAPLAKPSGSIPEAGAFNQAGMSTEIIDVNHENQPATQRIVSEPATTNQLLTTAKDRGLATELRPPPAVHLLAGPSASSSVQQPNGSTLAAVHSFGGHKTFNFSVVPPSQVLTKSTIKQQDSKWDPLATHQAALLPCAEILARAPPTLPKHRSVVIPLRVDPRKSNTLKAYTRDAVNQKTVCGLAGSKDPSVSAVSPSDSA